jgi:hypothetical protein
MVDRTKSHFFSNNFTSKFIEINDNPSLFYVIDYYRKHYNTQINMKLPQNALCIDTHPLTTFLVPKLQSFAANAWICFVKAMGTQALQIQTFDIKALKLWLCQS